MSDSYEHQYDDIIDLPRNVKKFDNFQRIMVLTDGTIIPVDEILELESDLF